MVKIFISTYPFCRSDNSPMDVLVNAGHKVIINPYQRKLKPEEVAELALDCDGIVAGTEELRLLVEKSNTLKIIARVGVGLDSVPLDLCRKKGIKVAFTPDAVTPAAAELTLGLILDVFRKISEADRELRVGGWSRPYGRRIGASTVGIIGFGRIGFSVARLLTSFNPVEILVHDILDCSAKVNTIHKLGVKVRQVKKEDVLENSDLVTLHVPRDESTIGMISSKEFSFMKNTAYLVNAARGGVVDEKDLYSALVDKQIAGAAMDVFNEEPYKGQLLSLNNVVLTQHMGSCSDDCRADMEREACEDIARYFSGEALRSEVV